MEKPTPPKKRAPVRHTHEITQTVIDDDVSLLGGKARLVQTSGGDLAPIELPDREFIVGSDVDCDLFVDNPTVSRHHFAISRDGLAFLIRDLRSTNGTLVNGVKIKEVYLQSGTSIQAGKVTFCFELVAPGTAPV